MTKEELQRQIQSVRWQINQAKQDQGELEEKLEALLEFKGKCNSKAENFLASVQRRKNKLAGISGIISSMKSAQKYWQTMNGMLTGSDYSKAKGSIDTLIASADSKKEEVKQKISDKEDTIQRLTGQLQSLQYQYDTYPEEAAENG